MKKICINGAPLAGIIGGIERYLYENIKRIDILARNSGCEIEILCPAGVEIDLPRLEYIKKKNLKAIGMNIDRAELKKYLNKNNALYVSFSINFCIKKGSLICIHDVRPIIYKKQDTCKFRFKYILSVFSSKLLAGKIITDSKIAKKEIEHYLHIKPRKIDVIYCGWEHINNISPDETIFKKIEGVKKRKFFYSLSSEALHKNFKWVEEVAKNNMEEIFLVGGKLCTEHNNDAKKARNVIYLGYVSDGENKALMQNCKAFLHPAKYEGFGLTPLEALACGAPICISNASCLPEIYEDCAHYFDPDDYNVDLNALLNEPVASPQKLLEKYSWKKSAKQWLDLMIEYSQE